MANHRQYYALARQLGWGNGEKCLIVLQYSGGKTKSLRELALDHPAAYREMLAKMREIAMQRKQQEQWGGEGDKWRKRVIACISAWLDATLVQPRFDRMAYIKSVACRTVGKPAGQFNQLTVPQLRTVYNSFVKQHKAHKRAELLAEAIGTTHQN